MGETDCLDMWVFFNWFGFWWIETWLSSGGWFNIKMSSCHLRNSHCGDKTVLWPCYLHNGISHTGKMISLYWIRALPFHLSTYITLNSFWHEADSCSPPRVTKKIARFAMHMYTSVGKWELLSVMHLCNIMLRWMTAMENVFFSSVRFVIRRHNVAWS